MDGFRIPFSIASLHARMEFHLSIELSKLSNFENVDRIIRRPETDMACDRPLKSLSITLLYCLSS